MIVLITTATIIGLMVGVEFAVAVFVNPIVRRLSFTAAIDFRAEGARLLGRVMPFWYIGSMILTGAVAIANWGSGIGTSAFSAALLLALSVAMSIGLLVPINSRTASWTAADHPADWREQYARWDRLHYIRVAIITGAFVLVLIAVAQG